MSYRFIAFIISIVMTFCSLFGISFERKSFALNAANLEKNITASQNQRIKTGQLTGAHIIVNQNGKNVLNKTYGTAKVGGEALAANATYRIASMTKPVTAVALLIEQDRGHLNVNDDVSKYLDGYKDMYIAKKEGDQIVKGEKAKSSVKIYQLVSHTSGIASGTVESIYNSIPAEKMTCSGVAQYLSDKLLSYDPGTSTEYSTGAFDVAAAIIEKTSGMEFSEYLKVNIFDKLGMTDTTFEPNSDQWARLVAIHGRGEDKKACDLPGATGCVFGTFPVTYHAAGAALMSTASDYSKFAEMLLNNGKAPDGTVILSETAVKQLQTPVVDDNVMPGCQKWGLGVRVITDDSNTLPKGSYGWSGAYGSHFWIDPTNRITAIYMKNSAYDGGAGNKGACELEEDVMKSFTFNAVE